MNVKIFCIVALLAFSTMAVQAQDVVIRRTTTTTTTTSTTTSTTTVSKQKPKPNQKPKPSKPVPTDVPEQTFTANGVSFKMIRVEGGTFTMGATTEQKSYVYDVEAHQVTLSTYYIAETEVTQELWEAVMGSNPSDFKGASRPVEQVSWNDCNAFISKLNSLTGKNFRLPTEAEWEYAARGGNKNQGYQYSGSNSLWDVAWFRENCGDETRPVKQKSPNELGLYDMCGNVWEWCQDWYDSYGSSSQTNPTGATSGSRRISRGGGWFSVAACCRVAWRDNCAPSYRSYELGLRLAL